jgi:uncharacterized membrane protein YfcA
MIDNFSLVLMSFLAGMLVGLTSMGGAALITPFLILVVGVRPLIAVGTDLVYGSITKIVGAAMHWKQGTVDLQLALRLASGSVPAGLAGVLMIRHLDATGHNVDEALRHVLGGVLVVVAVLLLARAFELLPTGCPPWLRRNEKRATIAWGAVVGLAVGLTSVGSGSLMIPFLLMLNPLRPAEVVGTDVFHAALLVTATAALHTQAGNVDWVLVPSLLLGSIPGVMLGSYLATRMPARGLKVGLSMLLFVTGIKLI